MTGLIRIARIIRIFTLIFLLLLIGALLHNVLDDVKMEDPQNNYKNDRRPSVHYSFDNLTMMTQQDAQNVERIWGEELVDAFKKNRYINWRI